MNVEWIFLTRLLKYRYSRLLSLPLSKVLELKERSLTVPSWNSWAMKELSNLWMYFFLPPTSSSRRLCPLDCLSERRVTVFEWLARHLQLHSCGTPDAHQSNELIFFSLCYHDSWHDGRLNNLVTPTMGNKTVDKETVRFKSRSKCASDDVKNSLSWCCYKNRFFVLLTISNQHRKAVHINLISGSFIYSGRGKAHRLIDRLVSENILIYSSNQTY